MAFKKQGFYSQVKQIGALTAIPLILVVGPLLGYFAGDWLDRKFQFFPWFTILGLFAGFVAAAREIFRLLKQFLEEEKKSNSSP